MAVSSSAPLKVLSASLFVAIAAGVVVSAAAPVRAETDDSAATKAEAVSEKTLQRGRKLFHETGCIQCHALADAGGASSYGPSLDDNPHLTRALALKRIAEGWGDMPSFAGILSDEEIAQLASYIADVAEPAEAP